METIPALTCYSHARKTYPLPHSGEKGHPPPDNPLLQQEYHRPQIISWAVGEM